MSLSDLASLGTFISSLAVVISFVFLGLQIRQADRSQRAALALQASVRGSETLMNLSEPHLADLYRRMIAGESDFSETEIVQLLNILTGMLITRQEAETRQNLSLMDEVTFQDMRTTMEWMFRLEIPRALWPLIRWNINATLRSEIDEIVNHGSPLKPPSFRATLEANLAKARASAELAQAQG